jgi:hypothetical protein
LLIEELGGNIRRASGDAFPALLYSIEGIGSWRKPGWRRQILRGQRDGGTEHDQQSTIGAKIQKAGPSDPQFVQARGRLVAELEVASCAHLYVLLEY